MNRPKLEPVVIHCATCGGAVMTVPAREYLSRPETYKTLAIQKMRREHACPVKT
jgi:hypothetical protein